MKIGYIVALMMIVFIVGCATKEAPPAAAPAAAPPAEAPPAAPEVPVEIEAPAEEAPAEAAEPTSADEAHIERLKGPCERGAIQSCLVLRNRYGIDWPPEVVEEPEVAEETVEVAGEEI